MSYRYFEDANHTALYAKYRPSYPQELVDFITDYTKEKGLSLDLAVDVGCGSGQGTACFADRFKKMVGIDISKEQIRQARDSYSTSLPHIEFLVGESEKLPILDDTVDLVTCAQCFHWFDQAQFFKEANRVLKPGGCLAVFGYNFPILFHDSAAGVLNQIAYDLIWPYWGNGPTVMLDRAYKDVVLPYSNVRRTFNMEYKQTVSDLVGFIASMSPWQAYKRDHPNGVSLKDIEQRFLESVNSDRAAEDTILRWRINYFLVIGRKS